MLLWSFEQLHNASLTAMPNLAMLLTCLMKCQGHLGISSGGKNFQIRVSLDVGWDGEARLGETET
jgi:hypothetical protein